LLFQNRKKEENKCSNVAGLGSNDKGRAHTGDMGLERKPKI
jgi:hypothetical protein